MSEVSIDNMIEDKLIRMELLNQRKSKKMTQEEVSTQSGLSVSTISNIESGDTQSITLRSLLKYAGVVGCKLYIRPQNMKEDVEDE